MVLLTLTRELKYDLGWLFLAIPSAIMMIAEWRSKRGPVSEPPVRNKFYPSEREITPEMIAAYVAGETAEESPRRARTAASV
jgi:hypothetical protein